MKKYLAWLLAALMLITSLSLAATVSADTSEPQSEEPAAAATVLSDDEIVYGDVDGDGEVTMKDVLAIRKFIAKLITEIDETAADVNGDKSVDMKDVLLMRKFIAGIISELNGQSETSDPGTVSGQPGDETSASSTNPTSPPETSQVLSDPVVIYDKDVEAELKLNPGVALTRDDIAEALQNETATYGIAARYIVTVKCYGFQSTDYFYSILIGEKGTEVWPNDDYDHDYEGGWVTKNTVCVLDGQKFADENDTPKTLYFYADSEDNYMMIEHITIGVVRAGGGQTPTTQPTQPTMPPITDSPVIYDEDVTAELSLKPGTTLELQDITDALKAETEKYGLAEQYIITVKCHAVPSDYYYSILLGDNGAEVWPDNNYDHDYVAGSIAHNTVCVLVGQEFADAGDAPTTLYFYADGENGTLFIEHIKIEVVRRSGTLVQPTSKTTVTTQSTQATTRTTQPGDTRPTGTGDYTYVGDTPYITFRSYGDECTLGTWWWYTDDATNATTCDKYLDFLYMNGVDEIYFYGYYWCSSNKTGLHSFVEKANAKGMAISLIYDDADTITASGNKEMSKIATNYLNYCAAYPSDQMAGIHFDVEGVSRDNMVTNMISQFAAARERGVYIAMDVNCKWTSSKTLNGVSGFMNIAAANLDCLSLMSYQDTANGIWNLGSNKTANPFGAAKEHGCKIVFGVEVGHYSFNADSDEFAQEGKEICYTELAKVREKLIADHPTGGYGLAVHMVRDWYTLKNK